MRDAHRLAIVLAGLSPLAGCGQYLGSYAVEEVRAVTDVPKSHFGSPSPPYGQYLEIRLASKTNLTSIGRDAVYVDADFCPLRNRAGLIAFGPYSDGAQDLGLPADAQPLKAGSDGLFRYRLYVVVAYKAQPATPGQFQLPTYDLNRSNRDLCLRLFAPSYNLIKSRSDTIRVPAKMISMALKPSTVPPASQWQEWVESRRGSFGWKADASWRFCSKRLGVLAFPPPRRTLRPFS